VRRDPLRFRRPSADTDRRDALRVQVSRARASRSCRVLRERGSGRATNCRGPKSTTANLLEASPVESCASDGRPMADTLAARRPRHVVRATPTLPRRRNGGRDLHSRIWTPTTVAPARIRRYCRADAQQFARRPVLRRDAARWRRDVEGRCESAQARRRWSSAQRFSGGTRGRFVHRGRGFGPGELIPAPSSDPLVSGNDREIARQRDPDR